MPNSKQVVSRTAFVLIAVVGFVFALSFVAPRPALARTATEVLDTNLTD